MLCLVFAFSAQAQFTVGANAGLMNYYGDVSDAKSFSFPFSSTGFSGGVFIEKPFGRFFIPQVQLFYGGINAQKDYLNVQAKGNVIDLSLKLQIDVMELIKKDAKLQIAPYLGGVVGFYNTEVTRTATDAVIDAGHVNNETGYNPAFGLGIGGRVGYQFNNQWLAYGSMDLRSFFSDEIDDYRGLESAKGWAGTDWTNYLSLGVGYTLSPKSKDIYEAPQPLIAAEKNPDNQVNGLFTYNSLPKAGVKMDLFNANNEKLGSTITDINGQFKFDNLSPDENYIVKLGEEDKGLFNNGRMYVINSDGKKVAAANKPGFNTYTFTQLKNEEVESMAMLVENMPTTEMKGLFVYEELPKGGVKIYLVDEAGNSLDSTITRADGSFKFSKLDPNANYLVRMDEEDASEFKGANLFFTNEKGEPVVKAATAENGAYSFKAMDEEELATLDVLTAEDGNLLYRKLTQEKPVGQLEEVADIPAKITPETSKPKPSTFNGLVDFENETIYFRHNSFWISQNQQGTKGAIIAKKLKENASMRIRIEGWSSQPGDETYNLNLSQKRAEALKQLLVSQYGIDASRIETLGKGEVEDSKLPEAEARRARIFVID
ncbi:MAG: OmpA family protein [Salibacteraceae bacterium]|nr:OmpA family protein [Salibacteraceae bacterium]